MHSSYSVCAALAAAAMLGACGGGHDHDTQTSTGASSSSGATSSSSSSGSSSGASSSTSSSSSSGGSAASVLIQVAPAAQPVVTAATLSADLTMASTQSVGASALAGILTLTGTPKCDVSVYHIEYNTVGGQGEATTASGVLMVPGGGDSSCSGALPIVEYAHGTNGAKTYDLSNLSNANGGPNPEGLLIAAFFAARGYIVVAPNYAGYDTSTLPYHPYLVRDQQATDMINALQASRAALPTLTSGSTATDNGKLFITGYSQGGFVAMAAHRAMEAAGITVTASVPMSGPYALAAFADADFYGQVSEAGVEVATLLLDGYQNSYGNLYSTLTDIINPPYAVMNFTTILPSATPVTGGPTALFDSTPPSAAYAAQTPSTTPVNLAPVYAQGFGANFLINNTYRLSWLQDEAANPDGGFPTVMPNGGLPSAAPTVAWRAHLAANDLRVTPTASTPAWIPKAPTLLCGGENDPEVFFFNTLLMQNYWTVYPPAANVVSLLDVDPAPGTQAAPGAYGTLQSEFQTAKAAFALSNGGGTAGDAAVTAAYHVDLVAPFCLAAAINFFDNLP
jgi:poly(3-hydroxybutyrate) depolymerase